MRIVSLLPAATEMVAALGLEASLVAVSHECDTPASVSALPRVTTTPVKLEAGSAAIDKLVRELSAAGKPVIAVDAERLRALSPEVVITQALCEVCAVADGEVQRLAEVMQPAPRVVNLCGRDLAGVLDDITRVGAALDVDARATALVGELRARIAAHEVISAGRARPGVLCVEWLSPCFIAGHWVPELIHLAGGRDALACPGEHSRARDWRELADIDAELVLIALCGYDIVRSLAELDALADPHALALLHARPVWVLDGNAFTSRPGPRLLDAVPLIADALAGHESGALRRWRR